ncbi:unnamed protein product [Caenorhabditis brenneri]
MEIASSIDLSDPYYSKNLTNVDVNWLTQPYLPQHPRTHFGTLFILAVLYAIYFRLWLINRAIFGIEEFRKNNSFIWFVTVLNYMNLANCLSSISMINVRLDTVCDGIYADLVMIGLVITSILSDCTYRSMIWFLIIICGIMCFDKLNKKSIIGSAIVIITIVLIWSTLLRTIAIRYDYNVKDEYLFRGSCLNGCCASGVIQIIPKNLTSVFEVLTTINGYINLVTVLAMILLISLLLVTMVNSITRKDRELTHRTQLLFLYNIVFLLLLSFNFVIPFCEKILPRNFNNRLNDIAYWTPVFTVICQILQMFATFSVYPSYRKYITNSFSLKKNPLCCGLCCVPK